jgi:hypothetical protein
MNKNQKLKNHFVTKKSSSDELQNRDSLLKIFKKSPVYSDEIIENFGLFLTTKNFSRMLFFYEMYKKIVNNEGVIFEFGLRWGQNLSLLIALRGMLEPYNVKRKIIGFDTFEGFIKENKIDNNKYKKGTLSLPKNYYNYLNNLLEILEKENPANHLKKYELIKGDAPKELKKYLNKNPEILASLVFFDMDIYEPTKECLSIIKPHLFKGSILAFDELNCDMAKGITKALSETFEIQKLEIKRIPSISRVSYIEL